MPISTSSILKNLRTEAYPLSQAAVLIPLLAGFVTPGTPAWAFFFYLFAIPSILLALWRGWRPDFRNPALLAMLGLLLWSSLTILWNHPPPVHHKKQIFWVVNSLWTLIFILNFIRAQIEQPQTRSRVISILVYGAAINAIISLVLFVHQGDLTTRLWGWGISSNPVMGAAIMDICLILALIQARESPSLRLPMAAACLPMIAFLSFSYSRTALLALAAAMLVIFLGRRPVIAFLISLVLAGVALVLWRFGSVLFPLLWQNLASRGDDCHAQLWFAAWKAIRTNPIIGFGPSATLPDMGSQKFCPSYPSPHNLYLSILLYSGGVGLAFFVASIALLWRHLQRTTTGFTRRLWLAVGLVPLVVGISDLIQIIKGPSPMWYIIWVPMLLVFTLPAESYRRAATRALPQEPARLSAPPADGRPRFVR